MKNNYHNNDSGYTATPAVQLAKMGVSLSPTKARRFFNSLGVQTENTKLLLIEEREKEMLANLEKVVTDYRRSIIAGISTSVIDMDEEFKDATPEMFLKSAMDWDKMAHAIRYVDNFSINTISHDEYQHAYSKGVDIFELFDDIPDQKEALKGKYETGVDEGLVEKLKYSARKANTTSGHNLGAQSEKSQHKMSFGKNKKALIRPELPYFGKGNGELNLNYLDENGVHDSEMYVDEHETMILPKYTIGKDKDNKHKTANTKDYLRKQTFGYKEAKKKDDELIKGMPDDASVNYGHSKGQKSMKDFEKHLFRTQKKMQSLRLI